jgi:hypothetical protein
VVIGVSEEPVTSIFKVEYLHGMQLPQAHLLGLLCAPVPYSKWMVDSADFSKNIYNHLLTRIVPEGC